MLSATYNPSPLDAGNVVTLTLTVTGNGSCATIADTKDLTVTDGRTVFAGRGQRDVRQRLLYGYRCDQHERHHTVDAQWQRHR